MASLPWNFPHSYCLDPKDRWHGLSAEEKKKRRQQSDADKAKSTAANRGQSEPPSRGGNTRTPDVLGGKKLKDMTPAQIKALPNLFYSKQSREDNTPGNLTLAAAGKGKGKGKTRKVPKQDCL